MQCFKGVSTPLHWLSVNLFGLSCLCPPWQAPSLQTTIDSFYLARGSMASMTPGQRLSHQGERPSLDCLTTKHSAAVDVQA